jgi:hypothetical protein
MYLKEAPVGTIEVELVGLQKDNERYFRFIMNFNKIKVRKLQFQYQNLFEFQSEANASKD